MQWQIVLVGEIVGPDDYHLVVGHVHQVVHLAVEEHKADLQVAAPVIVSFLGLIGSHILLVSPLSLHTDGLVQVCSRGGRRQQGSQALEDGSGYLLVV